ncbi:DUF4190 domain-containing protein [Leucobacter chromiireducens]|uniref:DUF4190 domain-containing protein n=1 Tax=Leucobacter chromiireducens TaxID=283877 RepID=UPI001F27F2F3|nr:DUF4190 domain-containing protein [Leucobacter chromiireducens]
MNTTAILPGTAPITNDAASAQAFAMQGEQVPSQAPQGTPGAQWEAGAQYGQYGFDGSQGTPAQGPQPVPAAPSENSRVFAIVGFVLGIASIVSSWTFIAPIAGLILSILALRRGTTERTLALWGVWLNSIMLAFTAIGILIGAVALGAGLLALPFAWL